MSLLELDGVNRYYRDGPVERVVLDDVSLSLEPGELAVVWGMRGSGRSTLLRVAAGIERPDSGTVRFEGRDLQQHGEDILGAGIGFCQKSLAGSGSQPVLDLLILSLLARGVSGAGARANAHAALKRTGATLCGERPSSQLDTAESVRVALARVIALQPRLLVIDDPIQGVDLLERDGILLLLRSLADEGIAVLASTGESTGLSGADRTLTIGDGVLRGPERKELAPVVELRPVARHAGG